MKKDFSRIRILLTGEPGVGKTSIARKYTMNIFEDRYLATISMDFYARDLDGIILDIWDLSGHPEFFEYRSELYKNADVLILVYDITSRRTFDSLDMWLNEATVFNSEKPVTFLCGNKIDLKEYRVVPINEARYWAKSRNIKYFEVSALDGDNLDTVFNKCGSKFRSFMV
jgi:small GTP-binding protein